MSSGVGLFRIWQRGAWQARGARAYNEGLGAEPPAWSRAEPLVGRSGGKPPPEVETIFAFERSMEAGNSPTFFWNLLENGKKRTFSYKVACKKFSWSGQREGRRIMPPLNTPLMMTMRLSSTDTEIRGFKDFGVTSVTFWGHVTSSFTWPSDSAWELSYWWSIGTKRLSCTVTVINVQNISLYTC